MSLLVLSVLICFLQFTAAEKKDNGGTLLLEDYDKFDKQDCFDRGISRGSFEIIAMGEWSLEQCLTICNNNDTCTGFSRFQDPGRCSLFSTMCPKFALHEKKAVVTYQKPKTVPKQKTKKISGTVFLSVPESGANTLMTKQEATAHCASLGATVAKKKHLFAAVANGLRHCDTETACNYAKGGNHWKIPCDEGDEITRCKKKTKGIVKGANAWCYGEPPEVSVGTPEPQLPAQTCPASKSREPDHYNEGTLLLEDYDKFDKQDCFDRGISKDSFEISGHGRWTLEECVIECNNNDTCTGFSHFQYPTYIACVLFSTMCPKLALHENKSTATYRKPAYSSGLKATYVPYKGVSCGDPKAEIPMKQVGYANGKTPFHCRQLCLATKGCCGFVTSVRPSRFVATTWGFCYLMNTTTSCKLQEMPKHVYYRIADVLPQKTLVKEGPVNKTSPAKEGPVKKTSLAKEGPVKKTSLAKEGPVNKTSPAKEGPAVNKTSLVKGGPVNKTSLAKEGPAVNKTSLAKEGHGKKTSGSRG